GSADGRYKKGAVARALFKSDYWLAGLLSRCLGRSVSAGCSTAIELLAQFFGAVLQHLLQCILARGFLAELLEGKGCFAIIGGREAGQGDVDGQVLVLPV